MVRIWDVAGARQSLASITDLSGQVLNVRWSNDGRRLANCRHRPSHPFVLDYRLYDCFNLGYDKPSAPRLERTLPSVIGVRAIAWTMMTVL